MLVSGLTSWEKELHVNWSAPQRPVDYTEETLVTAILNGTYPPGSTLPGERDLAAQLGVTRPTLREVLRRLERDGWVTIQQGKPTVVNHIWRDGGLNVLSAVVRYSRPLPPDFVLNLLQVRLVLAPAFTRAAVERAPDRVAGLLEAWTALDDDPAAFAAFDWELQRQLTIISGNPIYTLILNGFAGMYKEAATRYFAHDEMRHASRVFYAALWDAVQRSDAAGAAADAETVTRTAMQQSITLWQTINGGLSEEQDE